MSSTNIKSKIEHYREKLDFISTLFNKKELKVSYDTLKKDKKVNYELLYFKTNKHETKGLFIFSNSFFIQELKDHEFKRILGFNSLNYQIFLAYNELKNKCDCDSKCIGVKVSDIISVILKKKKTTISGPNVLKRILTLSYYLKWDLKQDKSAFDTEYFVTIPNKFIQKQKQRFNMDISMHIDVNENYLFFLNAKGDLCLILKDKDKFDMNDVKKEILPYLEKILNINKISIV